MWSCLVCGDDLKTAGKYVCNAKQCICGGIVHDRCINENTGALCECKHPQVLVHKFKNGRRATTRPPDNEGQQQ